MEFEHSLHAVTDDELLRRLGELVSQSRRVEADLVEHIGEVEERRLYAREASSSMFVYCTERLHLSEAEAFLRIRVARAARKHGVLLAMLRDGRLHLSGITLLAPLLTPDNRDAVLARATHRSKREIEQLVAELAPRPDVRSVIRKLPGAAVQLVPDTVAASELVPGRVSTSQLGPGAVAASELAPDRVAASELGPDRAARQTPESTASHSASARPSGSPGGSLTLASPSRPALIEPLSLARYRVQFTARAELREKLERLAALMRSEVPDGDLATIIEAAVTEKLERLEARRFAQTRAPRKDLGATDTSPMSRHIPAAVRRAVRERDGDRCGYVDEQGRRCSARDRLEFHHRHPFAMGGDHSPSNLRLLCQAHNRYLAEHDYGRTAIGRHRRSPLPASNNPPPALRDS